MTMNLEKQIIENMKNCEMFKACSAPLCPIDADIKERIWYSDDEICRSRKFGRHRWIKKQRSIKRRQTKTWLNRPVIYQELFDASRKRNLSEDQLSDLRTRMKKLRSAYAENTPSEQKMSIVHRV